MPLVLRPLRLSEVGAYERVTHAAFEKGLMPLFFPNGKTPGARAHMAHLARETMQSDPYARYMAVVDTELEPEAGDIAQDGDSDDKKTEGQAEAKGRIVGVAFWKFYEHERTDEEIEEEKRKAKESGDPPDCSVEMFNSFFGILAKCKKETMGNQPFILLNVLATEPAHHRRGIGAMHLKYGLDHADKLGLPSYLEASPTGKPLYERWGYEAVSAMPFDARDFGAPNAKTHTLMVRPGKKQSNGF